MRTSNQIPVEDRLENVIRDLEIAESRGAWTQARALEFEAESLVRQVTVEFEIVGTTNKGGENELA